MNCYVPESKGEYIIALFTKCIKTGGASKLALRAKPQVPNKTPRVTG